MMKLLKSQGLFFLLLTVALFFRFYNLSWGAPFFFHPDERQNVVYPVIQSNSLFMLDQKDFDNGTFPLIVIRVAYVFLTSVIHNTMDQTMLGILISRATSAVISVSILFLLYWLGKRVWGENKGYITFLFAVFSIGFIQFSHFGTIELWEAFFFYLLFYYSWRIAKNAAIFDGVMCGVLLGLAISTKVLSVILIPAICISFLFFFYHQHRSKTHILKIVKRLGLVFFVFFISAFCTFFVTFSQIFTNFSTVYSGVHFESDIALGKTAAFYTQGFYHTIPILFQFTHVYPFLLNPLITILFVFALLYVIVAGILKRNYAYLLVSIFFLFTFVSQSFFFVKWTRYMIPTLPFIYTILAIALDDWVQIAKNKRSHRELFSFLFITIPLVVSIIVAFSFFITDYIHPNTLIAASTYAKQVVPQNAPILSEAFDLGGTAFTGYFTNITSFDFYDLENSAFGDSPSRLAGLLTTSEYILLPSQRLLRTRIVENSQFPEGHNFYTNLFNGKLGFTKIYQTPCDTFCKITYTNDPVYHLEETATVFDRPTVFLFRKDRAFTFNQYYSLIH